MFTPASLVDFTALLGNSCTVILRLAVSAISSSKSYFTVHFRTHLKVYRCNTFHGREILRVGGDEKESKMLRALFLVHLCTGLSGDR